MDTADKQNLRQNNGDGQLYYGKLQGGKEKSMPLYLL